MLLPASLDLTGRTALATGAGSASGIGFATARALGDVGARVAITGTTDRIRARVGELREFGVDAIGFVTRLETADLVGAFGQTLAAASVVPTTGTAESR